MGIQPDCLAGYPSVGTRHTCSLHSKHPAMVPGAGRKSRPCMPACHRQEAHDGMRSRSNPEFRSSRVDSPVEVAESLVPAARLGTHTCLVVLE